MARRKGSQVDMNMDSLLDTLTNVVGVLVMVLMLTTLNVKSAVERILDLDPSQLTVSEADLSRVQQQATETRQRRENLAKQVSEIAVGGSTEDFGALLAAIDKLKAESLTVAEPPLDNAELRQKLESESARSAASAAELVKLEEELARLKARLDKTEVVAAPPPKIVKLPNPREAPPNAIAYRAIIREGKVVLFNPDAIRERSKSQVELLLRSPLLKEKNGDVDCEQLVETFNRRGNVADRDFKVRLVIENFKLYMVFDLRPTRGESAREVVATNSEFRRALRLLKQHGDKYYLRFLVWSDSFDSYVAARRVCDEMNVAAGWEPYNENFVWREPLGITLACRGRPAPPPPPKNPPVPVPKPTGPPPPPLPNDVVD